MATGSLEPIFHYSIRDRLKFCRPSPISAIAKIKIESFSFKGSLKFHSRRGCFHETEYPLIRGIGASHTETATVGNSEDSDIFFQQSFSLKRTERVEGKISIRLDRQKHGQDWLLTVGCDLPGKWVIHWGVFYEGVHGREWNQAPPKMRPSGSVAIKDYAIETPLKRSSTVTEGDFLSEVKISFDPRSSVESINFVLKDEESGAYYQHRGRDFMVPLTAYLHEEDNIVGAKKSLGILRDVSESKDKEARDEFKNSAQTKKRLEGFYEEHTVVKEISVDRSVSISVRKSPEMANNLLYLETDIPGDVFVHWGVCRDKDKKWVIPASPYPPKTTKFDRALETLLQPKGNGRGSWVSFTLDEEFVGFAFVLKAMGDTWIKHMGNDFYIPLSNSTILNTRSKLFQNKSQANVRTSEVVSGSSEKSGVGLNQDVGQTTFTDGIISEIKNLVKDISSEKMRKTKSKEAHEGILQEIEKLAAEAYSIFRTSTPMLSEGSVVEIEPLEPPVKISSGTGSGFEILCQGFNWESHKSGRWYMELNEKAEQLSSLGFSVIWLPPPTESVSPEGYMPKDLYNLNSRYGSADELKVLVERFHENGLKVLGDVVLNHRCAHHQNQNGVWNVFGGRLPWDDRAVVADDPHFQGRGNKSSGDNFHAAPNIDHSQDFVRKDIKEWLCWLREEIGFDGWRLDFVRGFWGGYVKDYLNATEPYFAVGEYWDSLNYTYGVMDHNQDAHRQRIVDWITATNGTAGAFDVTTKGILHSALEKCEYWRLSDQKGKPPGVVGWWPSRAITFIENHDTGSTQGHWRFPGGKEMQGYTYILTHPGTPSVFYDHLFSHYHSQIAALLSVRIRNKIHCRSEVKIVKAERDVYAAIVDDKVCMKIGPGFYEPQSERGKWSVAVEGSDYKVWEAL